MSATRGGRRWLVRGFDLDGGGYELRFRNQDGEPGCGIEVLRRWPARPALDEMVDAMKAVLTDRPDGEGGAE